MLENVIAVVYNFPTAAEHDPRSPLWTTEQYGDSWRAVSTRSARSIGLAEAVQTQRIERGLSARALSLEAGLSPSYVGKLEGGEIEPSVKAFAKIALVLGMNQGEIAFCVLSEALHESPNNSQEQSEAG